MAYIQALNKTDIFLHTPQGIELNEDPHKYVLKLVQNLYRLKDAGRTWWQNLSSSLEELGFVPSKIDPCVYMKGKTVLVCYVDDCLILSPTKEESKKTMQDISKQFRIMDDTSDSGTIKAYLGIQEDHHAEKSFSMSQPHLINQIIDAIPGMTNANSAKTPFASTVLLHKDIEGKERQENWNYQSIIGMLNYLVNSTRPELSFAVHQCARFCNNPMHSHKQAVKRIIRYLIRTNNSPSIGIICKPN